MTIIAASGTDLFGGTDVLRLLFLALGAALVAGNVLALIRPPTRPPGAGTGTGTGARRRTSNRAPAPTRPPLARSVTMIAIGGLSVIWALASLTSH